MAKQTNKILITGGAGFIGRHLSERLAQDGRNAVTIIDNLSRGRMDDDFQRLINKPNVNFIQADLTDAAFFSELPKDCDYIYHLAAIIGVKNVLNNPDKVLYVNTTSTFNLLEYAKGIKNLRNLFFSSTSEVYAGTLKHCTIKIPTDETVVLALDDISAQRTTYALSKICGESAMLVYAEKYGLPVTIGRYHNIYGPRMGFAHVIPEMFVKINNSPLIDVPSPYHTRAFCYIDDAVEFTVRIAESAESRGQIIHIGNADEEIAIKDLVMKIAAVMNRDITIRECPDTPGSPARRCPDISKAVQLTGFSPAVSLQQGLTKTFQWYKNRLDDQIVPKQKNRLPKVAV